MISLNKSSKYPYVFINTKGELDPIIFRALDLETSFVMQNVDIIQRQREMTARELGKKLEPWDGRIRFLNKAKNGSYYFPVGLLPKIEKILTWFDADYQTSLAFEASDATVAIPWNGPELYTHQIDAFVEAMMKERCIVNLPTGAGKTLLGVRIISALGKPTLILVHRKELAKQWRDAIRENTGIEPTMFNDKHKEFGEVTIAMIASLHNYVEKNKLPIFDVLISDECHHVPARTVYQTTLKCDARYRFGFSATPERPDGLDMYLEASLGPSCINVRAEDLVDKKLLAKPMFEFLEVPATSYARYSEYADDYKFNIVFNAARNKLIAGRVKQLVQDGRTIYVHVTRIDHGKILAEMLKAPFIYSKSKDRDEQIELFRNGTTKVMISTLLGEGVDIGGIDVIVMAAGGKSEIATIQRVGRALRPKPGKVAIIVDFIDRSRYLTRHTNERYDAYVKHYGEDCVRRRK